MKKNQHLLHPQAKTNDKIIIFEFLNFYLYNIHNFSGIFVYPINHIGTGWKIPQDGTYPCNNTSGKDFILCITNHSYSSRDILNFTNTDSKSISFFVDSLFNIIAQNIEIGDGDMSEQMAIQFNPNISYFIFIMDPKLQIITEGPSLIARNTRTMSPNSGYVRLFFKVKPAA